MIPNGPPNDNNITNEFQKSMEFKNRLNQIKTNKTLVKEENK